MVDRVPSCFFVVQSHGRAFEDRSSHSYSRSIRSFWRLEYLCPFTFRVECVVWTGSTVGTKCTPVHSSLYTGYIYIGLTPRKLRNQVVNLHCICNINASLGISSPTISDLSRKAHGTSRSSDTIYTYYLNLEQKRNRGQPLVSPLLQNAPLHTTPHA
jgi:hypothetical protein